MRIDPNYMNIKLKPCPFCGGEAKFEEVDVEYIFGFREDDGIIVKCSSCGAQTKNHSHTGICARAWNTRWKGDL